MKAKGWNKYYQRLYRKPKRFRRALVVSKKQKFVPRTDWPLRDLSCYLGAELAEMLAGRTRDRIGLLMLSEITRAHG